jgi:hypothetical protein
MRKLLFHLVLAGLVVAVLELGAFAALVLLRAKGYVYKPPRHTQPLDYATRMRIGHPLLGWPLTEGRDAPGGEYRDRTGARRLPAFPDPDAVPSCVSMYGDSFVESVELDHEHAAANLLARAIGCRVANFGQAGYGSDQAFMRYRLNVSDQADIVILGHMLENIRRNINRNRDLITGGLDYNLKPRFVFDGNGELAIVAMPELSADEYERNVGLRTPLLPLDHENFQPGGALVGPMVQFPYLISLARNLGKHGLRARIRGYHDKFAEFYEPGHPTQALELTVAIMKAFRAETARRSQKSLILLMPTLQTMTYHAETGIWVHQSLREQLDREQIPYLDFAPYLASHRDRDFSAYFTPGGHYNERGDALLARMMADGLSRASR